jgi:CRISPR-associated protein Cas2
LRKILKKDNKAILLNQNYTFIRFYQKHMYIIAVYDVGEKRVGKMLKLFRKYLHWIQNSVFEGNLTEVQLKELEIKAKALMIEQEDSIIIFTNANEKWMGKKVIGLEKNSTSNFI